LRNTLIYKNKMRIPKILLSVLCVMTMMTSLVAQTNARPPKGKKATQSSSDLFEVPKVGLPNGWSLSPIGKQLRVGDLPMKMLVHPSQRWILVQNAGQSDHSMMVIDANSHEVTDSMPINKTFYGMCFNQAGSLLFVSGGNNNWIEKFQFLNGKLVRKDTLFLGKPWPKRISPTGMVLSADEKVIFTVTKEDSSIYAVDLTSKKVLRQIKLHSAGYSILLKPINHKVNLTIENSELVLTEWGSGHLVFLNPVTL